MCDSLSFLAMLPDMTLVEYEKGRFPARGSEDNNQTSSDFRDQYAISPLTGAGFKITPFGVPLPGSDGTESDIKRRLKYGRIAGYLVDLNPPACIVGHNRELVNGVPAAIRGSVWLLKYWLAMNGCTRVGVDAISVNKVVIVSATPTFLFPHVTEDAARVALASYRSRSELLLNKKARKSKVDKTDRKTAYSYPPKQDAGSTTYIYTAYIRQREYLLDAYVKVAGAANAFCKPIEDNSVEFAVQRRAARILRIGTKLHAKWLRDNGLDRISGWVNNPKAYEAAFGLIRQELRLDEKLRSKQLRMPTIANLNLSQRDKKYLTYHLRGNIVSEHPDFRMMSPRQASQVYSASRIRVKDRTEGIDFEIRYDEWKNLFPELAELLIFPGEYVPTEDAAPYVFSRVSVPLGIEKLKDMVAQVLQYGPDNVPPVSDNEVYSGPNLLKKPARARGISNVPVDLNGADEDD